MWDTQIHRDIQLLGLSHVHLFFIFFGIHQFC